MTPRNSVSLFGSTALVLSAGFVIWTDLFDAYAVREQLKWLSPWTLEINFWLLATAVILNLDVFWRTLKDATTALRMGLGALLLTSAALVFFAAPRTHRIFYDEDIYLNAAQNIAVLGKTGMCNEGVNAFGEYHCLRLEYNKEPNAWPFLAGMVFKVFGTRETAAFLLNNLMFPAGVLVVYLLGALLFGEPWAGFYGAALYAFMPMNALWYSTASAEPGAAAFSAFAVLALVLCLRAPRIESLFLLFAILPFSAQFRGESVLIYGIALWGLFLWRYVRREPFRIAWAVLLSCILLLPHLAHLYAIRMEPWGSPGPKFAFGYLLGNIKPNSLFYLQNARFPAVFTALALLGVLMKPPKPSSAGDGGGYAKEKALLLGWFAVFFGVFLAFYAGSYLFGVDARFSLLSYAPLALLGGLGAHALEMRSAELFPSLKTAARIGLCLSVVLSFFPFLPLVRAEGEESWQCRSDHSYAAKAAGLVPRDSIVLSHDPNMFLVWGKNAAQISILANNPSLLGQYRRRFPGGVFFYYDYWCSVQDPVQRQFCGDVLKNFKTTLVDAYQERDVELRLYRVERAAARGLPGPGSGDHPRRSRGLTFRGVVTAKPGGLSARGGEPAPLHGERREVPPERSAAERPSGPSAQRSGATRGP